MKFSIIFLAAVFISATTYSQPKTSEPILSHGSIIITLITNDSIVIAADSKQSNRNNPNSYTNNFKIGSGNNFYYAIAGNLIRLSKQNSADTLDVYKIMDSIIKKTDNIDTIAPTFFRAVHKKYWDIVGDIVAKTVFELQDSINTTAIDLELLTFDGAVPIYRFYQFGFFKREIIPGVGIYSSASEFMGREIIENKKPPFIHLMGLYKEIDPDAELLKTNQADTKTYFTDLIRKQIKLYPSLIGEPIDIIVIYRNRAKWLTDNKY